MSASMLTLIIALLLTVVTAQTSVLQAWIGNAACLGAPIITYEIAPGPAACIPNGQGQSQKVHCSAPEPYYQAFVDASCLIPAFDTLGSGGT